MEEEFRAALLSAAGVSALTGLVSWRSVPQGLPPPFVVLYGISDVNGHTLEGPDGLSQSRVQADCYAITHGQAKALARAVRAAMDGFKGGSIQGVFHAGTRDKDISGTSETDQPFGVSVDFLIHYNMG
jgi:hypothetical protein